MLHPNAEEFPYYGTRPRQTIEWKPDDVEDDKLADADFVPLGNDPITGNDLGLDRLSQDLENSQPAVEDGVPALCPPPHLDVPHPGGDRRESRPQFQHL